MDRAVVDTVEALCTVVAHQCKLVRSKVMPDANLVSYSGPDPRIAELKRKSMDLTRALARLRGRGRF